MDVQVDLFIETTQPQRKWGKEELSKDYYAILKQLQPTEGGGLGPGSTVFFAGGLG